MPLFGPHVLELVHYEASLQAVVEARTREHASCQGSLSAMVERYLAEPLDHSAPNQLGVLACPVRQDVQALRATCSARFSVVLPATHSLLVRTGVLRVKQIEAARGARITRTTRDHELGKVSVKPGGFRREASERC